MLAETNQEAPHHTELDERTSWFYEAVGVSVEMMGRAVGVGQVYLEAARDSAGAWLRRWQGVSPYRAEGRACRAVLVGHRLRQRDALLRRYRRPA